jgi:signal transduction histidine kinase/CheY-like chemotaxis protein
MISRPNNNVYKTVVVVWLGLSVASVLLAALNWVQLHRRLQTAAEAAAIVDSVEDIFKSLLDVETSQRGYVISGDEAFLEPFKQAEAELPGKFDRFLNLAEKDPANLKRMTELRARAEVFLAFSRRVVTTRREQGAQVAGRIISSGEGQQIMDDLRSQVKQVKAARFPFATGEGRASQTQLLRASLTSLIAGTIGIGAGLFALYLARVSLRHQERERELLEAKLQAEHESQEKSTFMANMSHEIRTPMNAIMGFSELLATELREPKHRQYLQSIRASAASLLQIINDILDMSKVEAGVLELHPDPTDPREICDFLVTLFSEPARKKGIHLHCHTAEDLPRALLLDRVRLRQVLVNLVGNAVKFTDHGHIDTRITWEKYDHSSSRITLVIEVQDTGVGIPQDKLDAIFKPFVQAGSNRDKEKMGTGLGLAIVRRLTEAMGGTVTVASVVGEGSAFHLRFPGVPISARLPAPDQSRLDGAADFNQLRAAKILVVDDNQLNCDLIASIFAGSHHALEFGGNGEEAVAKADVFRPDIVLLDLRMPNLDGRSALEQIRRTKGLELLPVIAVSASSMSKEEADYREMFSGYLRKPFTQTELFEELSQFLPRANDVANRSETTARPEPVAAKPRSRDGLLKQLRRLETQEWPGLRDSLAINETREFGHRLEGLGRQHNSEPVLAYAQTLMHYADTYAVDELEKHLQQFPAVIQQLESISR